MVSTDGRSPIDERPKANTSAESTSPHWSFTQASYSAHAPSISTCDSRIGGQAPSASTADTNENDWPAR
jgi:hypothetical protein